MGILNLIMGILDSFDVLQYNAVLFCELTKALESVSYDLLLNKLKYYKFSSNSNELIQSFLHFRPEIVRVGGMYS